MSDFVAAPPAPVPTVGDVIAADWWPEVKISEFRDAVRIGTNVTAGRCRDALIAAMGTVAIALSAWRIAREADGATSLADIAGPTIAGEKVLLQRWRRAVYSFAAADLADTQSDITATNEGRDRREERAASSDDHRRNGTSAIRDILGKTRTKAVLI